MQREFEGVMKILRCGDDAGLSGGGGVITGSSIGQSQRRGDDGARS